MLLLPVFLEPYLSALYMAKFIQVTLIFATHVFAFSYLVELLFLSKTE